MSRRPELPGTLAELRSWHREIGDPSLFSSPRCHRARNRLRRWQVTKTRLVGRTGFLLAGCEPGEPLFTLEAMLDERAPIEPDRYLEHPHRVVRYWALVLCDSVGHEAILRDHLTDADDEIRLLCAAALVERGQDDEPIRSVLLSFLGPARRGVESAHLLGPSRDRRAFPALLELRASPSVAVAYAGLSNLAFPEALPLLLDALLGHDPWAAHEAIQLLGPDAGPLARPVVDAIERMEPEVVEERDVLGEIRKRRAYDHRLPQLFHVLGSIGAPAEFAIPRLVAWATPRDEWDTSFEKGAAEALGRMSHSSRRALATWLGERREEYVHAALVGLMAAEERAQPWRNEVRDLLGHTSATIQVDAANALTAMGAVRPARDAWLDWKEWPLRHHGTYPGLHALRKRLLRRLPDLEPADEDDRERTRKALETLVPRQGGMLELVDDVIARVEAADALAELSKEHPSR